MMCKVSSYFVYAEWIFMKGAKMEGKKKKKNQRKKNQRRNLKWNKERGKEEIKDKHKYTVITFSI